MEWDPVIHENQAKTDHLINDKETCMLSELFLNVMQ